MQKGNPAKTHLFETIITEMLNVEKKTEKVIPTAHDALYKEILGAMSSKIHKTGQTFKIQNFVTPDKNSQDEMKVQDSDSVLNETISKIPIIKSSKLEMPQKDIDNLITKSVSAYNQNKMQKFHPKYNLEIEASFGFFDAKGFKPDVRSQTEFSNLEFYLKTIMKLNRMEINDVVEIESDELEKRKIDVSKLSSFPINKLKEIMRDLEIKSVVGTGKNGEIQREDIIKAILFYGRAKTRCRYNILNPNIKIFEKKFRDKFSISIEDIGVRITSSKEYGANKPKKWDPHLKRTRRRIKFDTADELNIFYGLTVDLTRVQEQNLTISNFKIIEKYEVELEIEIEKINKVNGEQFSKAIKAIYEGLISNCAPNFRLELYFNMSEREYIIKLHNILFEEDMIENRRHWKPQNKYHLYDNTYWNKPVNIKLKDLIPQPTEEFVYGSASVFIKTNGKRMFLLITSDKSWLIMPPYTITVFGTGKAEYNNTYLDGEFEIVMKKDKYEIYAYHVFDVLFYKGKDVRNLPFINFRNLLSKETRFGIIQEVKNMTEPYQMELYQKNPHIQGNIYTRVQDAYEEYKAITKVNPKRVDGFIFQYDGKYMNNNTYKWKPSSEMTIDFLFQQATHKDVNNREYPNITEENYSRTFFLMVEEKRRSLKVFGPYNPFGFNGTLTLKEDDNYTQWIETVVECLWDDKIKTFRPIRKRDDRVHPNNYTTAMGVWASIHKPVSLDTLMGQDFIVMRKIHNDVKLNLLKKFLSRNETIIDIGSGRGGDLMKWNEIGLERVYCIEPNEDNGEELVKRLKELQKEKGVENVPDIDLLKFGAEQTQKIKERIGGSKIKAIVSLFSLTFFGKNIEMFDGLLQTISLLQDDGYFIGIVMDGHMTYNLLESTKNKEIFEELASYEQEKNNIENKDIADLLQKKEELESNFDDLSEESETLLAKLTSEIEEKILKNKTKHAKVLSGIQEKIEELTTTINENANVEYGEYKVPPLYITQKTPFDLDNAVGNEIEITLDDKTAMVKNQIEWLFIFDIFQSALFEAGFELIYNSFLGDKFLKDMAPNKFVRDQIKRFKYLENLPPASYIFSSLNRVFCFKKRTKRIYNFVPPQYTNDIKPFPNDIDNNSVIKGSIKGANNFIHAVLESCDDEYINLPKSEKIKYVRGFLAGIAKHTLTLEKFQQLHNGEYAKRMIYKNMKDINDEDEALKLSFLEFKKRFLTHNAEIAEVSILELLTEVLGVAIYVVTANERGLEVLPLFINNRNYCDSIKNDNAAVVVVKADEYYSLGRVLDDDSYQFVFNTKDILIQKLHDQTCNVSIDIVPQRKEMIRGKPILAYVPEKRPNKPRKTTIR